MRRIRKIEKHKEERDRSGKFKKARWIESKLQQHEEFTAKQNICHNVRCG
jgi:hypothetical protein